VITRSTTQNLTVVLCALALFVAQTFGQRGIYLCVCGGSPVPTPASHCHGPHGANCHSEDEGTGAVHSEDDSGPRQDHEVVKQNVQSRPVEVAPQLIAPQVLLGVLPLVQVSFASKEKTLTVSDATAFAHSPPFAATVARTVVLLI